MRHAAGWFNSASVDNKPTARDPRSVARLLVLIALAAVLAAVIVGCARIGDDRFPKLPDAPGVDATDFLPDAGPGDAVPGVDAASALR